VSYQSVTALEEAAWAGAILEAKGYASRRARSRRVLRLSDDRRCVLERFAEIVCVGKVRRYAKSGGGVQYRWEVVACADIEEVVTSLSTYLSEEARSRFMAVL
jgi:hypothetical protein